MLGIRIKTTPPEDAQGRTHIDFITFDEDGLVESLSPGAGFVEGLSFYFVVSSLFNRGATFSIEDLNSMPIRGVSNFHKK